MGVFGCRLFFVGVAAFLMGLDARQRGPGDLDRASVNQLLRLLL